MVSFAHRTGIEEAGAADHFITRHMGVAVEKKIDAVRRGAGRNMDEEKLFPAALE